MKRKIVTAVAFLMVDVLCFIVGSGAQLCRVIKRVKL